MGLAGEGYGLHVIAPPGLYLRRAPVLGVRHRQPEVIGTDTRRRLIEQRDPGAVFGITHPALNHGAPTVRGRLPLLGGVVIVPVHQTTSLLVMRVDTPSLHMRTTPIRSARPAGTPPHRSLSCSSLKDANDGSKQSYDTRLG